MKKKKQRIIKKPEIPITAENCVLIPRENIFTEEVDPTQELDAEQWVDDLKQYYNIKLTKTILKHIVNDIEKDLYKLRELCNLTQTSTRQFIKTLLSIFCDSITDPIKKLLKAAVKVC